MRRRIAGKTSFEALEQRTLLSSSGLAGVYFARTNATDPKVVRVDSTINFDWNTAPLAKSLGTDGFSVRWVGQIVPQFGSTYALVATAAGGERVWINNALVIDQWDAHSLRSDQGAIKFHAGQKYNIRIDYWTDGSDPQIKLEWRNVNFPQQLIPASRLIPAVLDQTAPSRPADLHVASVNSSAVTLAWKASTDPSGVVAYNIFIGKNQIGTTAPGVLSYTDAQLQPNTAYSFSVRAIDAGAHMSSGAAAAVVTSARANQPPSVPQDLQVTDQTDDSVSLSWSASTDDGNVSRYRVYRDNVLIAQPGATHFTDTGLDANASYSYTVRAVDNLGMLSNASSAVSAHTDLSGTKDAFSPIDGSAFEQSSGLSTSGTDLIDADDGDWARYMDVDFGPGANSVTLSIALPASNRGGWIELHLDSRDGTLIASHQVQPTGSFDTYFNQSLNVSDNGSAVSGVHDLYLVFKDRSGVGNVGSITFSTQHLTTIMALGDSITAGESTSPSYRYYLWQKLQQAGNAVDFVGSQIAGWSGGPPNFNFDQNHEGYPGITADQIASETVALATANFPDIVLLHAGSNDMEQGQSIDSTISDLGNIIDALRSVNPNVTILMAQIIPDADPTINANIDLLNAKIPDLAASKNTAQSKVIAVDLNTGMTTNDLVDGVHPNDSGDQKMANNWYAALEPLLS